MSNPFDVNKVVAEMDKDMYAAHQLVDELDSFPAEVVEKAYETWRLKQLLPAQNAVDALTPNLRALFRARLMNGGT